MSALDNHERLHPFTGRRAIQQALNPCSMLAREPEPEGKIGFHNGYQSRGLSCGRPSLFFPQAAYFVPVFAVSRGGALPRVGTSGSFCVKIQAMTCQRCSGVSVPSKLTIGVPFRPVARTR